MESEGLASRDRRREVPRIEMDVVGFHRAAGPGLGSCVGGAVVGGGHQHNAVSVFAEFDRGGDGDLCAEIVSLEGCERRSADFVAGRVEEQDRITRKIVLFGTFRHGFEGQRSAGIGFETAKLFLAEGAEIVGTARDARRLEAARAELDPSGERLSVVAGDLSDPQTPELVRKAVEQRWGALDILLNNAGIQIDAGAKGFIDSAVDAVAEADAALSELQDSSLPTEVGDVELRAGLTEVRELLGGVRQRAREVERTLGR